MDPQGPCADPGSFPVEIERHDCHTGRIDRIDAATFELHVQRVRIPDGRATGATSGKPVGMTAPRARRQGASGDDRATGDALVSREFERALASRRGADRIPDRCADADIGKRLALG